MDHGKTIFMSLVDLRSIVHGRTGRLPLRARFHGSLAFPGVTSFMRTPSPKRAQERKKLTFKPAIKTKNVKSLILKALLARPSRERQLVDAYNPHSGNLISFDIASRARSVPRRHPEIRVQQYVYRVGLL